MVYISIFKTTKKLNTSIMLNNNINNNNSKYEYVLLEMESRRTLL